MFSCFNEIEQTCERLKTQREWSKSKKFTRPVKFLKLTNFQWAENNYEDDEKQKEAFLKHKSKNKRWE